jgi:iron complex transport system permease protein
MPLIRAIKTPLTPGTVFTVLVSLFVVLLLAAAVGLSTGSVAVPPDRLLSVLAGSGSDVDRTILMDLRLPRVLMAILVGAGLSVAGAVFQALLRNPLAEPYILGISSGGTVGAVIAIGLGLGALLVPAASFAGSILVMAIVYAAAHRRGQLDTYALLLSGVMTGAFFNALILLVIAVLNQELRNAFLWLMGNLSGARAATLAVVAPPALLAMGGLIWLSRMFNLISTGDESAMQLGVNVPAVKRTAYLLASLLTGVVVSVSGIVGFVGLIIPHTCRILFGPDHRLLIPASALFGGTFMVLADVVSRVVLAPTEIPVGAVTAALGAPVFIYLLRKS